MKGILIVNLGTPNSPRWGDVYKYLLEFLLDGRVIDIPAFQRNILVRGVIVPFRTSNSAKLYKKIWTERGSPLKFYGESVVENLQTKLGGGFAVELAMRYQKPSIEQGLNKLLAQKITELIILPLFPQYASASTGSVHQEVMRVLSKQQIIPQLKFISSYPDEPKMIDIFVANAHKHDLTKYDHILFSYHGLPERQIRKGDSHQYCFKTGCCDTLNTTNQYCYRAQCFATTRALVAKFGLAEHQYTTCFQSRLGKDPWVKPYTSDVLKELAAKGIKKLLVLCPAFVADCLETTIEVSEEYDEEFKKLGGEKVQLVESLNDDPRWIEVLKEMIIKA